MEAVLLEVENRFTLEVAELCLTILEHFPIPREWPHDDPYQEDALVVRPDGSEIRVVAEFRISHFNIRGTEGDLRKSWRLTVAIRDRKAEEVPVGSKLLVSQETAKIILDAVALELGD